MVAELLSQVVEMQKTLAEGLQRTNANLAALVQNGERRQEVILQAASDGRSKRWDGPDRFRSCKVFAGRAGEWEEWSDRLLGTIKTRAAKIYSLMRVVEHQVSEKALEGDNYADAADVGMADTNEVLEVSAQLHQLLGDLTTGEAHAMVRRSRGENGLLAWKKLTSNSNPKTLASGLKCINSVHNPPRIAEVRQMDV